MLRPKGKSRVSRLPEELYLEILLRVPAKSIFNCKCVCKTWFTLISDPSFVKMHLDFTYRQNKYSLILTGHDRTRDKLHRNVAYSINRDSLLSSKFDDPFNSSKKFVMALLSFKIDDNVVKLEYPFNSSKKFVMVGSCDGLVCFRINYYHGLFYLWNPATKEYKEIPKSPHGYQSFHIGMYAFSYDCKIKSYKLVNVVDYDGTKDSSLVEVYMLRSNSWKIIETIPYWSPVDPAQPGVLVNGTVHWLGTAYGKKHYDLIISMEFSDEKFKELQLPKESLENNRWFTIVGALEECLCLLVNTEVHVELWVMQDYGVRESWTRRYTITHDRISNCSNLNIRECSITHYELLFLWYNNMLVLYDPKQGSARKLNIPIIPSCRPGVIYYESLVSCNGTKIGDAVMDNKKGDRSLGVCSKIWIWLIIFSIFAKVVYTRWG